jgi:Asp-tRNA(Asn)/Glu-tRNA(Gln) amidotransferase A subunit family amidase
MATEFGSPLYAGRKGTDDAAVVTMFERLGAVVLGKTRTTPFACFDPSATRNPRNPAYTPGGSSSGSAAAVAAGMVPFAIGSQTQGSVLRPASYCGVVGFKPTLGLLPIEGAMPFAPTLDTAGLFTATAGDMRLLWEAIGLGRDGGPAPRFGVPAEELEADAAMREAFCATLERLSAKGFPVETAALPISLAEVLGAVRIIYEYEGARTQRSRWEQYGNAIGIRLAELIRGGLKIPEAEYRAALGRLESARKAMSEVFRRWPVVLTPAAPGEPPSGLASTGDPRMNAPWTGLGTPAISVPMEGARSLPLGLQMTAAPGQDRMLVAAAAAVEECLC